MALHSYPPDEDYRFGLLNSLNDPKKQVYVDDKIVILHERKPKSGLHYLLLPRHERIDTVVDLRPEHIPLLQYMLAKGTEFANEFVRPRSHYPVIMGFHNIATFIRLHMHIMTTDFQGPGTTAAGDYRNCTHKTLWTGMQQAIDILKRDGRIVVDKELCEKIKLSPTEPVECYFCPEHFIYIPKLQRHLAGHEKELHNQEKLVKTDCRICRPVPMFFKRNKRLLALASAGVIISLGIYGIL